MSRKDFSTKLRSIVFNHVLRTECRSEVKILGASPEAFSAQSQLQLPFMQLLVICLLTVIRDIRRDHALAAVLPHRVYEVTFSPELSAPQLLLHLRCFRKHFARNYTLHRRDDPRRTVTRHRLGFLDVFSGTGTISFTEKTQPEYLFRTLLPQCVSIMARLP